MIRRLAIAGALVVVLAAVAAWYGTVEGARAIDRQQRGLVAARRAVGDRLLHPRISVYDLGGRLQCLIYPANRNLYGLELCFDASGRLVEAVDRRYGETISTLRWRPASAPLRIPPADVDRAVHNVPRVENRLFGLVP